MKSIPMIALLIAVAGCASQVPVTPASHHSSRNDDGRPPILFIGAPPEGLLPQQVIGEEHHPMPGDGHS